MRTSTRALSGAIEAEKKVAEEVIPVVGVREAYSTEEFAVVVTGVGTDTLKFRGNTTADTGGGIVDTVATLSGGIAANILTKTVGDDPDEVTACHTRKKYNSSTGERIVEDTKTKTGMIHLSAEEEKTEARGCNSAIGSLKIAMAILLEIEEVPRELIG